jgi:multicomponent Na+:H+ antiporter subunit D
VSQAGYIIMGLGLAGSIISGHSEGSYLAAYGSIFHIINHAIMKSLMFLCAGAVIYATGFRKMSELGGLGKKMPYTSACFFIAVLSISGVPLFNGFMSKISLFLAGAKIPGMLWVTIIAVLCSILTLGVCLRMAYKIFMGAVPKKLSGIEIKEVPAGMLSSMFILAFLCLLFGIFPGLLDPVLNKSANYILGMIKPVGG